MRHEEAMRFLSQRSGNQFDPKLIEIMSQLAPDDLSHEALNSDESPRLFEEDSMVESAYVDATFS